MNEPSERSLPRRDSALSSARGQRTVRQRGQVLAIFAAATILFVGILAIVIDVSWYWANGLRVQRAADAAALAGAVWLPGNVGNAQQAAYNEATKDGYTAGSGVTVTRAAGFRGGRRRQPGPARRDRHCARKTFFMRLFGITTVTAQRSSKAVYILPVPMGSPQAYYGVYPLLCASGASGCPAGGSNAIPDAARWRGAARPRASSARSSAAAARRATAT